MREKVLIVDDIELNREILAVALGEVQKQKENA